MRSNRKSFGDLVDLLIIIIPDSLDKRSASIAPLFLDFSRFRTLISALGRVVAEVIRSVFQTDKSADPIAFQTCLDIRNCGSRIHGARRPNPSPDGRNFPPARGEYFPTETFRITTFYYSGRLRWHLASFVSTSFLRFSTIKGDLFRVRLEFGSAVLDRFSLRNRARDKKESIIYFRLYTLVDSPPYREDEEGVLYLVDLVRLVLGVWGRVLL